MSPAAGAGFDPSAGGPGVSQPVAHLAWQLRDQARACAAQGSPLYARLLQAAADDIDAGGPTRSVLRPHLAPGRGDALALRLMAAVHRLVLSGRASVLAAHYPSAGGLATDPDAATTAFGQVVAEHAAELADLVAQPCRTNEVGRSAPVLGALLQLAGEWGGRPLRLLELGCSAGLNLRLDAFRYGAGQLAWGPPDSPVDLVGLWSAQPPWPLPASLAVAARRGGDRDPVDVADEEGRRSLTAAVWADQPARLERLRGALQLAALIPATVDRAAAVDWVDEVLMPLPIGCGTVLWHTVVWEYLTPGERDAVAGRLRSAGAQATDDTPLAWLRLEPVSAERHHELTLTTWPGGRERVLAHSGAHGQQVAWAR